MSVRRFLAGISALFFITVLVGGCTDTTVRVGLSITDEVDPNGRYLSRQVVLTVPSGEEGETVLGNVLVQAQKEGWRAQAGPISDGDYAPDGALMTATRSFTTDDNRHSGIFTKLFGPYYQASHEENVHGLTGTIYATGIRNAIHTEAVRYARSRGYPTDSIKVSFDYPVRWMIVCEGNDVTATRGTVDTVGGTAQVTANMYEAEFLAELPLTVRWREPVIWSSVVWQNMRAAGPFVLASVLIATVLLLYLRVARKRKVAARMQSRRMTDVNNLRRRIDQGHTAAKEAVRKLPWGNGELLHSLDELKRSAQQLADEIGRARNTAHNVDRNRLEWDVADLKRRLSAPGDDDLREDVAAVLEAKESQLAIIDDTEAMVERYLLRLSRIEATLNTLVMKMAAQDGELADEGEDREAIEAVRRELEATDAAIEELKSVRDGGFVPPPEDT